jgi:4-hydroxy-4-methyl-2-oxoglutarate aldolase
VSRSGVAPSATLASLARLGAATVYEAGGRRGAFDAGIKPLDPRTAMAGTAVTVDVAPGDNWYVHVALLAAGPGDVLVVDAKGFTEAGPWGDLLTVAAQRRGLAGLVIDGAVRDGRDIVDLGFPVFSRGRSIKGTTKVVSGRVNVPVRVGGVEVHPGDVLVGDGDGLVRVAAGEVATTLAAAQERARVESTHRQRLRAGETTLDVLGLSRP